MPRSNDDTRIKYKPSSRDNSPRSKVRSLESTETSKLAKIPPKSALKPRTRKPAITSNDRADTGKTKYKSPTSVKISTTTIFDPSPKNQIRISCRPETRAASPYGDSLFNAIFDELDLNEIQNTSIERWAETSQKSEIFAPVNGDGPQLPFEEVIILAIQREIEFTRSLNSELMTENFRLRDAFYKSAAKIGNFNQYMHNNGLYREFTFMELPPVDFLNIRPGQNLKQRFIKVPVGTTKFSLYFPLSAKSSIVSLTLLDLISGIIYFSGEVEIKDEGWIDVDLIRPVSDAQNALELSATPKARKGSTLLTTAFTFSSRFRSDMAGQIDEKRIDTPLAHRIICGPPIGSALIESRQGLLINESAKLSIQSVAKNIAILKGNTVAKVTAKAGPTHLEIEVEEANGPINMVLKNPIIETVFNDQYGRLNAVIIDITVYHSGSEEVFFGISSVVRSPKTGRFIDEAGLAYSAKNGWRISVLCPLTTEQVFDLLLRFDPSVPVREFTVHINAIRGVSFS